MVYFFYMEKIKLLYLTPHLSTGGMPQFVLKRIQELQEYKYQIEIFLVEYSQFSDTYVVQRNEIIELLGEGHFFSLGDTTDTKRKYQLINIIKDNNIDIVHSEEMLEGFESFNKIPLKLMNELYSNDRTWKMIETCHNVWFNPQTHKKFSPDAYSFVTPHHINNTFSNEKPMKFLSLYPIENKVEEMLDKNGINDNNNQVPLIEKIKVRSELGLDIYKTHILNVGLWTSGKNQKEGVDVARELVKSNPELHFHFIGNQAPNFEDYWGSIMKDLPSNVTVWGERSDVNKFMTACDVLMFNSTWECNPLVVRESINYGMKILTRNLPQYEGMFDGYITPIEGDVKNISNQLINLINSDQIYAIIPNETFGEDLLGMYQIVNGLPITENKQLVTDYTYVRHYVTQPYFEIQGTTENKLNITCYDGSNIAYKNDLPINSWIKLNKEYFIKWRTTVEENGSIIYDETLNLKDKRVYISFGSKSLGDTIAWIPYCEEFRKKHDCKLIVSTFLNNLFEDQYPEIEFSNPGNIVPNIHAQYRLGWFYDNEGNYDTNRHPNDFKQIPLQKTASDILGIEYKEIRPLLKLPNVKVKKKVGIGFHSTAQAKYWNNTEGWQKVIDHLNELGYECMIYSKEGDGYMNNNYPNGVKVFEGQGLQSVINDLVTCEFFIGLSSGLSWLAWACELPVVLISGFSEKWAETTLNTYRVINQDVCHGCFNWSRLDSGDWNWCPKHKGDEKQFECSKTITSEMVIQEIDKITNKTQNNDDDSTSSDDSVTIVLSHADNEWRKNILDECLEHISGEIILSSNFPVETKTQKLCDWVLYNKNNPLLSKEMFEKFNLSYDYWSLDSNGNKITNQLDYDHGYAAYTLIQQGIKFAKQIGKNKVHIINYDYIIDNNNINQNNILLDSFDSVLYTYKEKSYSEDSYCVGFLSGNVDMLEKIFSHYKSIDEYYSDDNKYKILEVITYNLSKKYNLNVKELYYEDLNSLTNREGVLMFSKNNDFNKFKYISDKYDCDKTSRHEYHKVYTEILHSISDEEFNLFEIGIDRGKSVNVWRDYLKNAKIYGLDIDQEWSHDRGKIFKGDQSNIDDLQKVVNTLNNCRIIIDDGSHNPEHQIKSFHFLFKNLLESGGYYVIEDIETSYWDPLSSLYGYEVGYLNIIDYFSKLNHQLNHKYNNLVDNLGIEFIKFSPNSITIKKI